MNVDWIASFDADVEIRPGDRRTFETMGFVFHGTPSMCTCAESADELDAATDNPHVAVILTTPELASTVDGPWSVVGCPDPAHTFWRMHAHLANETDFYGVHRPTVVHDDAEVHPTAVVADEGVTIGAGCRVSPGAVLLPGVTLAEGVKVGIGTVVGSEAIQRRAFGDERLDMPHRGGVYLDRGAQIGIHAVVHASIFNGPTYVGPEAYVGDQVIVGHEVTVGERAMVLPGAILFGSSDVEAEAYVSCGALITNLVTVGEKARVSPGALVTRDVAPGATVTGHFAIEHRAFLAGFRRFRGGDE